MPRQQSRLTAAKVIKARKATKYGSIARLARLFGVSYWAMYRAVWGKTFRRLNRIAPPRGWTTP